MTLEDQLSMWKQRCVMVEKTLKQMNDLNEHQKIQLIEQASNLEMWKQRALTAEQLMNEK